MIERNEQKKKRSKWQSGYLEEEKFIELTCRIKAAVNWGIDTWE